MYATAITQSRCSFVKALKRLWYGALCTAIMILILPVSVYAAEQPLDLTDLSIEELVELDIDYVRGASGFRQKVTEAPSSVTVIYADEIKKFGYRTLSDVLKGVRSFYVSYDRNYSYCGVRGFARPGDYNTRVLLMVDGIRINDNVYDMAPIGTDFPVDIDLIDKIEIIRGPAYSLYGSSALLAVVNIITKRGQDYRTAEVSGAAGNQETFKGRVTYGNDFRGGPDVLLSASYYTSSGEKRLYFPEFDTPQTNYGIAENLDNDRYASTFVKLSYGRYNLTAIYGKRVKDIPTAAWGTIFNDPGTYTEDQYFFGNLEYYHLLQNQGEFFARLTYGSYKYTGDYLYDYPPRTINRDKTWGNWWGSEARLTKKLLEKHRVTGGVEFRHNFKQDQQNYDVDPYLLYTDDQRSSTVWAVYLQDEVSLARNLILNLGVRYDHYSTFGDTANPRFALIYKPFERTILKALYGRGFRAPNAYELYYSAPPQSKANPNLDPEIINSYELVAEQYLGKHLSGTLGFFHYKIKDLISQRTDPTDGSLVFENVDSVKSQGVELELRGKWKNGLQGHLSYTYHETEDVTTGSRIPNSPRHLAKAGLIVPIIPQKVFLGLEEQFTGSRKTIRGNTADSFFITNLTLHFQNMVEGLEISGSVYNLLDKDYADPGSGEHVQDLLRQDGRTFSVKVRYRF